MSMSRFVRASPGRSPLDPHGWSSMREPASSRARLPTIREGTPSPSASRTEPPRMTSPSPSRSRTPPRHGPGPPPHTLAPGGSNTVTVHDQAIPNGTASHIWTVTITNENPAFTSGEQGCESAQNDTLYAHDYNAADASGDYLYFTFVTNNTDLNIGPLNGTVWGHLTTLGIFYVNVTVHDDADPNGTDWNNYTLTVSLQPPEIGGGDSGGA